MMQEEAGGRMDRQTLIYVALGLASEAEATAKRAMLLGARLRAMALAPTIEILEEDAIATMQEELMLLEQGRLTMEGYGEMLAEVLRSRGS